MWRDALDAGRAVSVAAAGGRIVGFAAIGPPDDEQAPPGTGELHAIYLRAAYAGHGIGRALLMHAEGSLDEAGYRRGILWVLETNERARRFYERAGWSWDGTVSTHRFDCAERPVLRYARDL